MSAPERRDLIRTLLESSFYCGTAYAMPLRERLALVKKLEAQMGKGRNRQGETAHGQACSTKLADGPVV